MRLLAALLLIVANAPGYAFEDIRWPDPNIPIPAQVQSFIVAECMAANGLTEETVDECVHAEGYGYRAVVTMLLDVDIGNRAVERYRICASGLGSIGGKFHRRKAAWIGKPLQIAWRFEFTQKAVLENDTRVGQLGGRMSDDLRQE